MPPKYRLQNSGEFVIDNYNLAKPWASFFPGIAGLYGIPLWAFYVNRGQCIASMGIRSKDDAIMEFLPANKAYQLAPSQGFRTFIKIKNKLGNVFYEPFSPSGSVLDKKINSSMSIRPYDLTIEESNPGLGLKVSVNYFPIVNEPFAGLVRELTIENTSKNTQSFELLDGASVIVPCGVNNWFLKEMSRTIEAWMGVTGIESGIPLFKLSTDPRDTAQVAFVKGANFYTSFKDGMASGTSKIVVDPAAVFGEVSDLSYPAVFAQAKNYVYPDRQVAKNKTPCAFTYLKTALNKGKGFKLYSLIGHLSDAGTVKKFGIHRLDAKFVAKKKKENQVLIDSIMDRIFTSSASKEFDLYARQTYLDNVLRGGLPHAISEDGSETSLYVFSRKHGDLERDYNRFFVSATYFSEGEGNYRDVNQNRRSDLFFNPAIADKNIRDFIDLIQLDGYNPLIFKGERFVIAEEDLRKSGIGGFFHEKDAKKLAHILAKPFTIGEILSYIGENKIHLSITLDTLVKKLLTAAKGSAEASFGEGYWSDHWTYNTDLLDTFLSIYPDRFKCLLLEKKEFTFYDTHVYVKPRHERYCVQHGEVRQYHAIGTDEGKSALFQKRHEHKHMVRARFGDGDIFVTTLLDKLLCLIANKLATLDPYGAGIEMEADKPNWYDALNGLPGLFGSSISETFELKRLIEFLKCVFDGLNIPESFEVSVTGEVFVFIKELETLLKSDMDAFEYWDLSNVAKESYRTKVRRGVSGDFRQMDIGGVRAFFDLALKKLEKGIAQSYEPKSGFYRTYFSYRVSRYDTLADGVGRNVITPKEFQQHRLALFLEGFVHALRCEKHRAKDIYRAVKKSPLWDKELKMYKVNASLSEESFEIGRTKAFTPGWLENESIWLHMEYKYLLELLKNGLYKEFYTDLSTMFVPFQDASRYGRSILENSSFIASSAHPDAALYGRGFVARLSGSTAEFIHMWRLMNIGDRPFFLDEHSKLALRFAPALPASFFTVKACKKRYVSPSGEEKEIELEAGTYAFLFLGKTIVIYKNPKNKDTFGRLGLAPKHIRLFGPDGLITEIKGDGVMRSPYAEMVRSGVANRIEITLG
ncbi:MAG TPA: hypothetical protein DCL35_04490 [Candidatus Omnitrophica bacterium]|nr:hypothetical protein [Candidatus Omnitrophota bacterium]